MQDNRKKFSSDGICSLLLLSAIISLFTSLIVFLLNNSGMLKFLSSGALTNLLFCASFVSFVLLVFLFFYYRLIFYRGIKTLKVAQTKLEEADLKDLNRAVTKLACGDLTARAAIHSQELTIPGYNEFSSLMYVHNHILKNIHECIKQLGNVTNKPCDRICYVGADSYHEGEKCGQVMGEILGGKGQVAILISNFMITSQAVRMAGFRNYLELHHPGIKVIDTIENQERVEVCYQRVKELLQKSLQVDALYLCEGTTPSAAARAVADSGKAGAVRIVCHDLAEQTMEWMAKGVITATVSQNPFMQGFDPVIHLYNYLLTREKPALSRYMTEVEVVTQKNYKELWNSTNGATISQAARKFLATPGENKNAQSFKIGVILPDDKVFWKAVLDGVLEAKELLKNYHVTVTHVVPRVINQGDWSYRVFIPEIENFIKQGYDAIAISIFDQEFVPYINEKIAQGVPFATFNAEPINFRGLVDSVSKNSVHLYKISESLTSGVTETSQGASQINSTMQFILAATTKQLEKLSETEKAINSLLANINRIIEESHESANIAKKNADMAKVGYDKVKKNHEALMVLQGFSQNTTDSINTLNADTLAISEIISIIKGIADQTNILAMNASIEAATAGEAGKGFAVVAEEIKNLSFQTTEATNNITQLIQTILTGVQDATRTVVESMNEINNCTKMSEDAEVALNEIMAASLENENKVENIILGVEEEMQRNSREVGDSLKSLDAINHENGRSIEDITASVQEMNQQVGEMIKMAKFLSDIAHSQDSLIKQFILEDAAEK